MSYRDKSSSQALNIPDTDSLEERENRRKRIVVLSMIIIPLALFFASFVLGRYSVPIKQVFYIFAAKLFNLPQAWTDAEYIVVFQVRLPRILAAVMIGGALSISGAAYQGLFKNPMVSPDILGASAGAGLGAAIALLFDLNSVCLQFSAFIFGIAAVALTYVVSNIVGRGNSSILLLVLTGLVVSTMFQAFISIIKTVADPNDKLPAITFWLMGGLSSITYKGLLMFLFPFLIGTIPLILLRWKLNVLSFGEEEAKTMGINTKKIRMVIILCSTLLTAGSVAIGGIIGWVGLVIPHLARIIVGPNYKILIPTSIILGATYLLFVDDVARTLFAVEIPIGILTALIGAPFFICLLLKTKGGGL